MARPEPDRLERAANRDKKYTDSEEWVRDAVDRLEMRQCMICGVGSGDERLLPPGWSHATEPTRGDVIAFFCDECSRRLRVEERRDYLYGERN
jgi:hypothetical protein